jgi:D-glycero-D-manno-heptose 1,7-bisphosphate phosphatase
MTRKAAIFLDRDETLNQDRGYIYDPAEFAWMPGAAAALRRFHTAGLPVFVVTNQGGIGRGMFTEAAMHQFNNHLIDNARAAGGDITDIAFCPHHPLAPDPAMATACRCRKPEPGLIIQLAEKWQIDLTHSVMIGDRDSDVEAGKRAGMHSYLFDKTDLDHLAKQVLASHFPAQWRRAQ